MLVVEGSSGCISGCGRPSRKWPKEKEGISKTGSLLEQSYVMEDAKKQGRPFYLSSSLGSEVESVV